MCDRSGACIQLTHTQWWAWFLLDANFSLYFKFEDNVRIYKLQTVMEHKKYEISWCCEMYPYFLSSDYIINPGTNVKQIQTCQKFHAIVYHRSTQVLR